VRRREFSIAGPCFLRERLGAVVERLVRELRGALCIALKGVAPGHKSLRHAGSHAVDALDHRFGRGTVTFAATGTRYAWKLRSAFSRPVTRCAGMSCCGSDRE
jgi:hypothetical protein